ncbi:MAG: bifunctional diguanylate cyclase/phosphodiesterase [Pseudomonadota bacterium]
MDAAQTRRSSFRVRRRSFGRALKRTFLRPQMVAFLPALVLGGYWFGGQGVLMIIALTFPMLLVLGGLFDQDPAPVDGLTGLLTREALAEEGDDALLAFRSGQEAAIVIVLEVDNGADLAKKLGPAGMETVLCRTADRLASMTRRSDRLARLGECRFGLLLTQVRNAGMDVALRTVERLQGAVSEPISIDAGSVYVTLSAGVCLEQRAPARTGDGMIAGATTALEEARVLGHGAIRAYSSEMQMRKDHRKNLAEDLSRALETGEVLPWFQPQVCARTGRVAGMEALCRWHHSESGVILPSDFLPVAEAAGLLEKIGETMLFHGLSALRRWERSGLVVQTVGINFSTAELRNPKLVEKVRWELDRFDLAPERLAVEILETVVADTEDDTITHNIAGLAQLGCTIDLDDFGVGAASIANIRRFAVSRIKIDRSFVTRVDADPAQRKMVDALLSMAEKLDLATLAEGVETVSEQTLLTELGCHFFQGYAIARPMPLDAAEDWLRERASRLNAFGDVKSLSA